MLIEYNTNNTNNKSVQRFFLNLVGNFDVILVDFNLNSFDSLSHEWKKVKIKI